MGNDHGTVYENGVKSRNDNTSSSYDGWIDLFGWGTSGYTGWAADTYGSATQPWATDTDSGLVVSNYGPNGCNDLTGDYANGDWGVYNRAKLNGTGENYAWRTPTFDEFHYILDSRSGWRFVMAGLVFDSREITVTFTAKKDPSYAVRYTVEQPSFPDFGLILFPDGYTDSTAPYADKVNKTNLWEASETDIAPALIENWEDLELAGCVFLPVGSGNDRTSFASTIGQYWTSTSNESNKCHAKSYFFTVGSHPSATGWLALRNGFVDFNEETEREGSLPVRLVRDAPLSNSPAGTSSYVLGGNPFE